MNVEKLQKLAGSVRTGGKGSARRKHKAMHKGSAMDDKKLQATLKRLGVTPIPGIEEVNIFKDDDVVHFVNPKGKCAQYYFPYAHVLFNPQFLFHVVVFVTSVSHHSPHRRFLFCS